MKYFYAFIILFITKLFTYVSQISFSYISRVTMWLFYPGKRYNFL